MPSSFVSLLAFLLLCLSPGVSYGVGSPSEEGWIELSPSDRSLWRDPDENWSIRGDVALSTDNNRHLVGANGEGVLAVTDGRQARDLYTKRRFRDVAVRLEYLLPCYSNSGVKLNGLYEIQLRDTHGQKLDSGDQNGGIYPRADKDRNYALIDKGFPPLVDATLPAGKWQKLMLEFRSPRFDSQGKKVANARFDKVVLNGKTIHKDVEVKWPTGWAWEHKKEGAEGPLMLQGNHGNVAFRNIAVWPLEAE